MLYVASRLFITLATVYLPLYTEEAEVGGKRALATVPLVSYVSSFVAALLLKHINRYCGTKVIRPSVGYFYTSNSLVYYTLYTIIYIIIWKKKKPDI